MITAFGKFCRKLRIEHDEILKDMASKLNVTSAYLSAVEMGKRNIPEHWGNMLREVYNLNIAQSKELKVAIDSSVKQIKLNLDNVSLPKKQAAIMFARKLDELGEEDIKKIFEIIKN